MRREIERRAQRSSPVLSLAPKIRIILTETDRQMFSPRAKHTVDVVHELCPLRGEHVVKHLPVEAEVKRFLITGLTTR